MFSSRAWGLLMPKPANLEPADNVFAHTKHIQFHITELKDKFPDLQIDQAIPHSLSFFSKDVNSMADSVEFITVPIAYNYSIHYARPYKEIPTECERCHKTNSVEKIGVYGIPDRIPLLMEYTIDAPDTFIYSTAFEDIFEQLSFSKSVVGKSRLYVVDFLKKKAAQPKKIDEIFIPNSIKKIMVFS